MKITVTGVPDRIDIQLDRFCPFNDGGRRRCGNWCVLFGDESYRVIPNKDIQIPICHGDCAIATPADNVAAEYFRSQDVEDEE